MVVTKGKLISRPGERMYRDLNEVARIKNLCMSDASKNDIIDKINERIEIIDNVNDEVNIGEITITEQQIEDLDVEWRLLNALKKMINGLPFCLTDDPDQV